MESAFCAIEWLRGAREDLHVVRCSGDRVGDPQPVISGAELERGDLVVCFRPAGLCGSFERTWRRHVQEASGLDGSFLARVCLPTAESYGLEDLGERLGVRVSRADPAKRAVAAAEIVLRLLEMLSEVPLPILAEMERLLGPARHPIRRLVKEAAEKALTKGFGRPHRRLEEVFDDDDETLLLRQGRAQRDPPALLDVEAVCRLFAPEGRLGAPDPNYEYRPEQVRMAKEVAEAFNDGLVLLAEAGTGTGKSMAYLAPAVQWALRNDEPVIVSTNTKNLQAQLCRKDIPRLERAMGGGFRFAIVKGRGNYLCLRQLHLALANGGRALSAEERLEVLPVLTWLGVTKTGDVAENAGFRPGPGSELWNMLSARSEGCIGPRCRWWRWCFVRRARVRASNAHVVVANHATVLSDAGARYAMLPEHRCIIFDEAHNLEDVATSCLGGAISSGSLARILNRLFGAAKGAAGGAGRRADAGALGEAMEQALSGLPALRRSLDRLFGLLSGLFERTTEENAARIRYDAANQPAGWSDVVEAAAVAAREIEGLADRLEAFGESANRVAGSPLDRPNGLGDAAREAAGQAGLLRALAESLGKAIRADDERFVYWVERDLEGHGPALCTAPLEIGQIMSDLFYSRKRAVVFTSATLTVGGAFDFMRGRLGLHGPVAERTRTTDLGTSFDFPRQVLAVTPTFLPEPRGRATDFVAPFCELAEAVLRMTRGRGLVLFTSHAMLREAAARMAGLPDRGYPLLAQGIDGGRDQLLSRFARETASVLLGTQSFWEGIDVPGESLTCLILARLPFRPHTDPVVAARCERIAALGGDPFREYMVPDAAIRLRQGFGRLIRSREDRGVVVICDRRLLTRPYGRTFLRSLSVDVRAFKDRESMLAALEGFLNAERRP